MLLNIEQEIGNSENKLNKVNKSGNVKGVPINEMNHLVCLEVFLFVYQLKCKNLSLGQLFLYQVFIFLSLYFFLFKFVFSLCCVSWSDNWASNSSINLWYSTTFVCVGYNNVLFVRSSMYFFFPCDRLSFWVFFFSILSFFFSFSTS